MPNLTKKELRKAAIEAANKCCICQEQATEKCLHCGIEYFKKHYLTTVVSGNCCFMSEECASEMAQKD